MNCTRCGNSLEVEAWEGRNFHFPFCEKCFYTCPICNEFDPGTFRFRIIKTEGTHYEVEEIVCLKCGKEWERNRYKEEMCFLLSSGVMLRL